MSETARDRPIEILLIEDSPGDVRLTREALRESKMATHLSVVGNGVDAMDFLRRAGKYADAPNVDLVILDLNLPKKDGRQVLEEIKSDPDLKEKPVVIFTTSSAETDIRKSYDLHANCYVTKPMELDRYMQVMRVIDEFWLSTVQLPGKPAPG